MGRWSDPVCIQGLSLKDVPDRPGVYRWLLLQSGDDPSSAEVVYVGKACGLRKRIRHHKNGHGSPGLFEVIQHAPYSVFVQFRVLPAGQDPAVVEADLLNQFEQEHHRLPLYNRIHGSRNLNVASTLHLSQSVVSACTTALASGFLGGLVALALFTFS